MVLFLELAFTISFSLVFSFCFAWFLSIATTDAAEHDLPKKKASHVHDFPEESEGCNLEKETEVASDQRPKLFAGEVGKTEEKLLDEAREDETQMGLIESKDYNWVAETGIGFSLDDQSPELYPGEDHETEEKPVDEAQGDETEMGLMEDEVGIDEKGEIGIKKNEIESDDWVGIERSEVERLFGCAVAFVDSKVKNSSISSDLKLQFFGLYQVAMAGPCLLPQPMALKFSARAKWDAWQQFGNLSSEEAMEHYINLLSSNFPGWREENVTEP